MNLILNNLHATQNELLNLIDEFALETQGKHKLKLLSQTDKKIDKLQILYTNYLQEGVTHHEKKTHTDKIKKFLNTLKVKSSEAEDLEDNLSLSSVNKKSHRVFKHLLSFQNDTENLLQQLEKSDKLSLKKEETKGLLNRLKDFFTGGDSKLGFISILNKWVIKSLAIRSVEKSIKTEVQKYLKTEINNILEEGAHAFIWKGEARKSVIKNITQKMTEKYGKRKEPIEYFSSKEIDKMVNHRCRKAFNKDIKYQNRKISKEELKIINKKQELYQDLIGIEGEASAINVSAIIEKYPVESFYFDVLSQIPTTAENKNSLVLLWKGYCNECVVKGKIDQKGKKSITTPQELTYYSKLMEIIDNCPKEHKTEIARNIKIKEPSKNLLSYISSKDSIPEAKKRKISFIRTILNIESTKIKKTLLKKSDDNDRLFRESYPAVKITIDSLINEQKDLIGHGAKDNDYQKDGAYELAGTIYMHFASKDIQNNSPSMDNFLKKIKLTMGADFSKAHKEALSNAYVYECMNTLISYYKFSNDQIQALIKASETTLEQPSKELKLETLEDKKVLLHKIKNPKIAQEIILQIAINELKDKKNDLTSNINLIEKTTNNILEYEKYIEDLQQRQTHLKKEKPTRLLGKLITSSETQIKKLKNKIKRGKRLKSANSNIIKPLQKKIKEEEIFIQLQKKKILLISKQPEAKKPDTTELEKEITSLEEEIDRNDNIKKLYNFRNSLNIKTTKEKLSLAEKATLETHKIYTQTNKLLNIKIKELSKKTEELHKRQKEEDIQEVLELSPEIDILIELTTNLDNKTKALEEKYNKEAKIIKELQLVIKAFETDDAELTKTFHQNLEKILFNTDFSTNTPTSSKTRKKGELLSPFEMKGLSLVSKLEQLEFKSLKPTEREDLKEFLKDSLGNMNLNKRLGKFLRPDILMVNESSKLLKLIPKVFRFAIQPFLSKGFKPTPSPHGIPTSTIKKIHTLTYSTRQNEKFMNILKKSQILKTKITNRNEKTITDKDRLSMSDLGLLENMKDLNLSAFSSLNNNELKILSPKLLQFKQSIPLAEKTLKFFEDQMDTYLNKNIPPGVIQLHHAPSKSAYCNRKLAFIEELTKNFSGSYIHAGIISKDDKTKKATAYEVWEKTQNKVCKFDQLAYSHFFKIDPVKLGNMKLKNSHIKILNDLLDKASLKAHQEMRKNNNIFSNNYTKQQEAGMAEWSWLNKLFFNKPFPSSKKIKTQDLSGIAKSFIKGNFKAEGGYLACSAFASMVTLATLHILKQNINKDPAKYGLPKEFKLELPFDSHRDFELISPTKLNKILSKKGCLTQLPPPKIMQHIIKHSELKRFKNKIA